MMPGYRHQTTVVDGLETAYLEAGSGAPLVLLHGGEFGASAELGWERVIDRLAETYRVIAPDVLGFGGSAKVVDFVDGRGMRIRHIARLLETLGIERADFAGNSMGGVMLLVDQASERPVLPVDRMAVICGGGEILQNEHSAALFDYDGSLEGMRRIVRALFDEPEVAADDAYVARRHASSLLPGAWEAVASARFRRPGHVSSGGGEPAYGRIAVPTLVIEGAEDKLKPAGWAAGIAARIPGARSVVVDDAGHCPQLEQPDAVVALFREWFAEGGRND
jgi:pimeloyl-ACP methyl ester carboxylesterase